MHSLSVNIKKIFVPALETRRKVSLSFLFRCKVHMNFPTIHIVVILQCRMRKLVEYIYIQGKNIGQFG